MYIEFEIKNDCCTNVKVNYTPTEWLVANKALRLFSEDNSNHIEDLLISKEMLNIKPTIKEIVDDN